MRTLNSLCSDMEPSGEDEKGEFAGEVDCKSGKFTLYHSTKDMKL